MHDNDSEDRMEARLHEKYTANNKRMIAGVSFKTNIKKKVNCLTPLIHKVGLK